MTRIHEHEKNLVARLLEGLARLPKFTVWGLAAHTALDSRVPTVAVTHAEKTPADLARFLAEFQVFAWHGNMYAIELTERLGLEKRGGVLRLGLVHYNTVAEVDQVLELLARA